MERRKDSYNIGVHLDYASQVRSPERLSLVEDEGYCTLTLPLISAWVTVLPLVVAFTSMSVLLCGSVGLIVAAAKMGMPFVWKLWEGWGVGLLVSLMWGFIAVRSLRTYRRYGRVPLSLSLNKAAGVLRIQAQGSGRWREMPVANIKEVNLKILKSLIPAAEMVIRFRGFYSPIRRRFKGDDVLLGEKFAFEVKKMIAPHRGPVILDPSP